MDSGATSVTIANVYSNSGQTAFYVGAGSFNSEPTSQTSPYYFLYSRKFTFLVQGGFDGWDIYREYRTNADRYRLGNTGYKQGALAGCVPYTDATGWGAFRQITVGDNTVDYANTDYYAYLLGAQSFANPEITNINVLVTPGIDYVNNGDLVEQVIDIVENDRADSIYICTTPDFNLLQPSTSMENLIYPQEAVDNLENTAIDSNYTATYYPWVLTRDTVNNTQIYIPATAEATRNFALTDNIAFPWFATAGYTRGVVNAVRARKRLTQEDRDTLYKGRINPIATFNDVGTVIWGNKTLQIRESALDRINVRRLLLQARKLISAVAVRLLFEQNDNLVRQQFLDSVNPILDAIRRDRGLYDFRVTVQNTPEDLDANQMVGKIYIKPTKALEFIDIEFLITPTGASFENI
jgi:phage tail sheath protein FI